MVSAECGSYFKVPKMQRAIVGTSASRGQRAIAKRCGTSTTCRFGSADRCSVLLIDDLDTLPSQFRSRNSAPLDGKSLTLRSWSVLRLEYDFHYPRELDFDVFRQHHLGEDLPHSGVELLLIDLGSAVTLGVAAFLV